ARSGRSRSCSHCRSSSRRSFPGAISELAPYPEEMPPRQIGRRPYDPTVAAEDGDDLERAAELRPRHGHADPDELLAGELDAAREDGVSLGELGARLDDREVVGTRPEQRAPVVD